jgi:hypothetical protein
MYLAMPTSCPVSHTDKSNTRTRPEHLSSRASDYHDSLATVAAAAAAGEGSSKKASADHHLSKKNDADKASRKDQPTQHLVNNGSTDTHQPSLLRMSYSVSGLSSDDSLEAACDQDFDYYDHMDESVETRDETTITTHSTDTSEQTDANRIVATNDEQQRALQVIADLANLLSPTLSEPAQGSQPSATCAPLTPATSSSLSTQSLPSSMQSNSTNARQSTRPTMSRDQSEPSLPDTRFHRLNHRSMSLPAYKPATLPRKSSLKKLSSFTESTTTATTNNTRHLHRSVSFGTLQARVYNLALSDHPSCSVGPPIQLGWEYEQDDPVCLHEYENNKSPARSPQVLNSKLRQHLLVKRAKCTRQEIMAALREVDRVKRQRAATNIMLPIDRLWQRLQDVLSIAT